MGVNGDQRDRLAWKETKPGIYERELDFMESLYHQVGLSFAPLGREQWCVSLCIKLDDSNISNKRELIRKVQSSWTYMRIKHPELAAIIEHDRRIYKVLSPADGNWTKEWIDDTFNVVSKGSADEYWSSLPSVHGQETKLWLFSESNEILIRSSHSRIDGKGGIFLLDDLLHGIVQSSEEAINNFSVGDDLRNLSPSIDIATQLSATTDEDMKKAVKLLVQGAVCGSSIGLDARNIDQLPGDMRRFNFIFTPEETSKVVKAVKKRGYTVTQAVHTALLLASKLTGTEDRDSYSSVTPMDIRSRIVRTSKQEEDLSRRAAAYHIIWPINIKVGKFSTTLQKFKELYTSIPGRQPEAAKTGIYRPVVDAIKAALSTPPTPPNTSIGLSSLGIIDDLMKWQIGGLHVTDFWVSQDVLIPNVICTLWTRSGRMQINASYNEQYYSEDDVKDFLGIMKKILFHGLGIQSDSALDLMI